MSGLPHVTLAGINVNRCAKCGEVEVEIPRVEKLHKAIAGALVRKAARLSGAEVRFLRSQLGYSGADFAKVIGVSASTVSRWENEHEPIGPQADRLLRLMVATRDPQRNYELDQLANVRDTLAPKVHAHVNDSAWQASVSV